MLSKGNWVLNLLHILVAVVVSLSLEVCTTSRTLVGVWVTVRTILISMVLLVLLEVVLILVVLTMTTLTTVRLLVLWLHGHHQSPDNLSKLIKVLILESAILFLLVTSEVLLVSSVFIFEVTVLLDLVMVHIKISSTDGQILSVFYELSSVWSFVANEGIWAFTLCSFKYSDGLNFSEAFEKISERLFSFFSIETFDIQITSLF